MLALGGLLVVVGIAIVAFKALFALALLPFKIGFGLLKLVILVLVGIPVLILGASLAIAVVPVLLAVGLVVGLVAAPVVLVCKVLF